MVLSPPCAIDEVKAQLDRALPRGMRVTAIDEVPLNAPALQMQLAATEFEITVEGEETIGLLSERVSQFLAAAEVRRDRRGKVYNLRPLVQALSIESAPAAGVAVIRSRLQATPEGTGRPDELAAALGLDPATVKNGRNCSFLTKRIETV
jgi:hypothetical protein